MEELTKEQQYKQQIQQAIERYHQEHYWGIFPSGGPQLRDWHYDALIENLLGPLYKELEELRGK